MERRTRPLVASLLAGASFRWHGEPIVPSSRKGLALLVVAAVSGEPWTRAALAELLWASRRTHNVRQALHALRSLPGAASWLSSGDPVAVHAEVDLHRFLGAVRAGDHDAALLQWRVAHGDLRWPEGLWRELEAGAAAPFVEWLEGERQRLQRALAEALEAHAAAGEERGALDDALEAWHALVATDPLHESAHAAIMRAHLRRGDARAAWAQFERCRRALREELGVEPLPQTQALADDAAAAISGRRGDDSGGAAAGAGGRDVGPPLPAVSLTGRRRELAELAGHLGDDGARLVTLTGPGGVGKTSLALAAARRLAPLMDDGVRLAWLGGLGAPDLVASALASALDVPIADAPDPERRLREALGGRSLLLVADELEGVLDGCGVLAELVRTCPRLRVLATSREPLGVPGERVLTLAGLSVPDDETEAALTAFDAVRCVLEAARRADPGFVVDDHAVRAAARIARALDGLPLGLELAGSWAGRVSLSDVADGVERDAGALAHPAPSGERHASLAAAFSFSWALLSDRERAVLRGLTPFRGGFDRGGAEAVAGATLRDLLALVAKSLLRREPGGRFDMLAPVRELVQRWAGPGDARAHARHVAAWAERVAAALPGPGRRAAQAELARERANLEAAWRHAVATGDRNTVATLLHALDGLLTARGSARDAERLLLAAREALAADPSAAQDGAVTAYATLARLRLRRSTHLLRLGRYPEALDEVHAAADIAPDEERVALLLARASARYMLDEVAEALDDARAASRLARDAADTHAEALGRLGEGRSLFTLGHDADAREAYEGALAAAERVGDPALVARALSGLGVTDAVTGAHASAVERLQRAAELSRDLDDVPSLAISLNNLARCRFHVGDVEAAEAAAREALGLRRRLGDRWGEALALSNLAPIVAERAPEEARDLLVAAATLFREVGNRSGLALAQTRLAEIHVRLGALDAARAALREALERTLELEDRTSMLDALHACAALDAALAGSSDAPAGSADTAAAAAYALLTALCAHPAFEDAARRAASERLQALADRVPEEVRARARVEAVHFDPVAAARSWLAAQERAGA